MRPYFERDGIVIFHADCRDVLPNLQAQSVDLALTDPPYGIGLITKTSDARDSPYFDHGASLQATTLYRDDPDHVRELITQVIPMLSHVAKRMMIFPGPRMLWSYPEPSAIGCVFTVNGAGRSPWGFQCMHPLLFYGRDPFLEDGQGGRPNSFRTEQANREHFDHPCPKPLSWMQWCVARGSREGELICDPFMGVGTTLVAAYRLGRRAIGIEVEEKYCEVAADRLRQSVLPLSPDPSPTQLSLEAP